MVDVRPQAVRGAPADATAPPVLRLLSLAVDVAVVAVACWLGILLVPAAPWQSGAVLAVLTAALLVLWRSVWGSSVGHEVVRLRTVRRSTWLPAPPLRGRAVTVRRAVDDPLRMRPRPVSLDPVPPPSMAFASSARRGLDLVVDDGTVHVADGPVVVGRTPSAERYAGFVAVPVPDVGRTISRTHMLLEDGGDTAYATDLGGVGGTRPIGGARLSPGVRTPIAWNTTLVLGQRAVTVRRRSDAGAAR